MGDVKFIYILGTGRSGSTLIDILLGNSKKLNSLGEIYHTFSCWIKDKECSCGQVCSECVFWSKVKKQFLKEYSESDLENLKKIQNKYERSIFAPLLIFLNNIYPTENFKIYQKQIQLLFTSISANSSEPIFIDSSKNPFRAYMLLHIFKENIYIVHLVRDGRGALWSWIKSGTIPPFGVTIQKGKNEVPENSGQYYWWTPWMYSISWLVYNIFSSGVTFMAGPQKAIRIQYEDILRHPADSLKRLENLIKEDLSDLAERLKNKLPLKPGHLIAGNRLRHLKEIHLKQPDEEWRTKLFKKYNNIFWMLSGWLLKRYGYKR